MRPETAGALSALAAAALPLLLLLLGGFLVFLDTPRGARFAEWLHDRLGKKEDS